MYTTKDLAGIYGVTPQTINRWIKNVCDQEGVKPSGFGTTDPSDKRIRTFSEQDMDLIRKYYPTPKTSSVTPKVEVLEATELNPLGLTRYQMPEIRGRSLSTTEYDQAAEEVRQESFSAIQALQEFGYMVGAGMGAEIMARAKAGAASIEHSIAAGMVQAINDPEAKKSQLD